MFLNNAIEQIMDTTKLIQDTFDLQLENNDQACLKVKEIMYSKCRYIV